MSDSFGELHVLGQLPICVHFTEDWGIGKDLLEAGVNYAGRDTAKPDFRDWICAGAFRGQGGRTVEPQPKIHSSAKTQRHEGAKKDEKDERDDKGIRNEHRVAAQQNAECGMRRTKATTDPQGSNAPRGKGTKDIKGRAAHGALLS